MAWLAVNKDGSEVIGNSLLRAKCVEEGDYNSVEMADKTTGHFWCDPFSDSEWGVMDSSVILPKGTIKKLIGHELTWEDNPVELK